MKTKSYNVYSFAELTPEAQKKAIERLAKSAGEYWNGDQVIDDAKEVFALCGFDVEKVYYSGFWSQGDGACFEGSWNASKVNLKDLLEYAPEDKELARIARALDVIAKAYPEANLSVKHYGHYSHKYCTEFNVSICDPNGDEIHTPEREQAEKDLIELSRDAMQWIYRNLQKAYEYETSEEAIKESIEANEYEFTADGKID